MKQRHLITGVLFWCCAAVAGWWVLRAELSGQAGSVAALSADVGRWVTGQKQNLSLVGDQLLSVAVGDPIFLEDSDGRFRQVGLIVDIDGAVDRDPVATRQADVVLYDDAVSQFPDGFRFDYYTTPMSLDWVVETMIPPERQTQIAEFIASEWKTHQRELTTKLRPVLRAGMKKALQAVEDELPTVLQNHRDEFRALGDRYETEILKAEVIPLVKDEILPIVEQEALPVAEDLGRALWKRVSLWSFTWRFLYDRSPLPRRDAVKAEFQRFVQEEALPELRSRTDEFIEVTETIVKRSLENPRVKEVLKRNLKRVAEDEELHRIVWAIVRESVIDNQTLRKELEDYMKQQETQAAMKLAGVRLEPAVRTIGDMIFGTRETGITPEFSRILRSQILAKDRRWFVMVAADIDSASPGTVTASWSETPMVYPMGFSGYDQSPLTPID